MTKKIATTREYNVVVERDDAVCYVASVPALPGCHTQARSLDELMVRTREAVEAYVEPVKSHLLSSSQAFSVFPSREDKAIRRKYLSRCSE